MSRNSVKEYPIVNELLTQYFQDDDHNYSKLSAQGLDPFYLAVRAFEIDTAKFWFETLGLEFNRNKEYPSEQNILYLAVQDGDLNVIKTLIEYMHFDINVIPKHGYSVLGNAIENSSDKVFRYLLELENVRYNIRDNVAPFNRPLDKVVAQQDLSRVFLLLTTMLKHNIFLNSQDLDLLREKISNKNQLETNLQDYLIILKHNLKLFSSECILSAKYTARELLGYLELWNVQSRIDGLDSAKVSINSTSYKGFDAIKFIMNELLPLVGFGFLPADRLVTAYKTFKDLEVLYKLPTTMELNLQLDESVAKAIEKYTDSLNWDKLKAFNTKDLHILQQNIAQFNILAAFLAHNPFKSFIVEKIADFNDALSLSLEPGLTGVIGRDLSDKIGKVASAMRGSSRKNLDEFVAALDNKQLPKATTAFLLSNSGNEHNKVTPAQSEYIAEQKNNKKDLFDLFD